MWINGPNKGIITRGSIMASKVNLVKYEHISTSLVHLLLGECDKLGKKNTPIPWCYTSL